MSSNAELFCDGGCIGKNPSPHGGTWAWCLVEDGERVAKASDCVLCTDYDTASIFLWPITNNQMELAAAVMALCDVKNFRGTLWTDSQVTLWRLTGSTSFNGIPQWLVKKTLKLRRGRQWTARLLAGHPTKVDLARGWADRPGGRRPVSIHNVWADQACQKLATKFLEKLQCG